jgi:hypothetical protein
MKPLVFAILLTTFASFSVLAEPPDERAGEAIQNTDKPFAVAFSADGCLMCRALPPASRNLAQRPDFMGITLFVAKFDTEKVLERSLGITEPRTIEVFKGGARSTAVTQYDTLSGLLKKVIR